MPKYTVSDEEFLHILEKHAGNREATALELGIVVRNVYRRIAKLKKRGKLVHEPQVDGKIVRQSTLTNKDGEIVAQWDIRVPEKVREAQEAMIAAAKADIVALPPRAMLEKEHISNLANEYVFSDVHLGQMANCDTSEQLEDQYNLIVKAFSHMMATSPPAETAIVVILGDWFHFDNLLPMTPRSQNVLFANGNFRDMVEVGVKLMRKIIDFALMAHKNVELVICEGNHDQASAQWLKIMMMALYDQEPRLRVADSDTPFIAIPWGDTFLGYHHGHIKGLKSTMDLALYFAAEFRPLWGETVHTYLKTGHLHHIHEKEEHGVLIKQQPTLASKDHHSHQHGYRSAAAAVCTSYSKITGECGTNRVTKEMLL